MALSNIKSSKIPQVASRPIRDLKFDLLKAIGIIGIILGHTISKEETFLYQLRSFDVPLMVMVSGSLFWQTSKDDNYSFLDYLKKRILRLMLPIWCFLIFFFAISYPMAHWQGIEYPFSFKQILYTFTLLIGGIGYVWIIRVFLLIALISPLFLKVKNIVNSNYLFTLFIIFIYGIYQLILFWASQVQVTAINSWQDFLFQRIVMSLSIHQILLLLLPYSCVFAFGIMVTQMKRKSLLFASSIFLSIFVVMAINYAQVNGGFVLTQSAKYPPRLYYLSYGLFASIILYLIADYFCRKTSNILSKIYLNKIIIFLGNSSLWIYLWHIFMLYYWGNLFKILGIDRNLIPKFFVIYSLSVLLVFLQKIFVSEMISKIKFGQKFSRLLTIVFLK